MALTAAPKITVPWANTGVNRTSIPTTSQISVTPGAASWTDGFPPLCMTPIASGGIPPAGPDFNGVLYSLSQSLQWLQAGSGYQFDGAFATAVGGYPLYAQVQRSDGQGLWINTIANNTADPESSTSSGWLPLSNNATTAITMTSSNVTLTPLQAGAGVIYLSGTLTTNLQLIFPTWAQEWLVVNNCTGAFSVTCKTASGSGVAVAAGSNAIVYGDGTNISAISAPSSSVVGSVRNGAAYISSASVSMTYTCDEIIVGTAIGGAQYRLSSLSKVVNISTTGAGGMDTGSAPVNGYVAVYVIYNPTTATSALLATNATSAAVGNVYVGANMPSGYTASALIAVLPTNASSQFKIARVRDRRVGIVSASILSTSTAQASLTSINASSVIPLNAISAKGNVNNGSTTTTSNISMNIAGDASGIDAVYTNANNSGGYANMFDIVLTTPQTMYYTASNTSGTPSFQIFISGYSF